ncbi:MAG: pyruvate dehydrogenase (acetyl-transferring), homodimeric type [Planctomycetota bacterium]|nr:pyruvate dehydrogenase (acetyl-transferring), homodimeric type [Planctomycetota bacterium]
MVIEGVLDRPQGTMPVTTDPRTVGHNGASTVTGSIPESDPCPGPRADDDPVETSEWRESVRAVASRSGGARIRYLLDQAEEEAFLAGAPGHAISTTPYVNSIRLENQPAFPGNLEVEERISNLVRWNAMAMVVRANEIDGTVGGHISTFASSATLYEVAHNHFFKGQNHPDGQDFVYFQGHASPDMYARAFLEGRLSAEKLINFRRELQPGGGLSSYPHPWLMPDFWQFPTVSMGLGPIMGIYQARFQRYLENRGLKAHSKSRIWCFLGDGECDEPETLGALTLGARERLDNLTFVINCNLQRLDGPVRGNGKIMQELEGFFRGAGWNVVKVVWASEWDALLARDHGGHLRRRMDEVVDGELQKYVVETGAYMREHFFGKSPELLKLVEHLSDEELKGLRRGGQDPIKVYAGYQAAVTHLGRPTVVLAHTVKGFGMGDAGEGLNIAHQQKKLKAKSLLHICERFSIPLTAEQAEKSTFCEVAEGSIEHTYLHGRREELGGYLPSRTVRGGPLEPPSNDLILRYAKGSGDKTPSTTGIFVDMLSVMLKDPALSRHLVPIIPDEARTFGMDPLFTNYKIYNSNGQKYEPVDSAMAVVYKEAVDGQLLEEGINESGAMSSFIAAGTSHANAGVPMIPFYIYYSMFGFQRVGDLIWAAADLRCRGFMLGATAGRTSLNGEGLQHEDGHTHVQASVVPTLMAYDPAYAFELACIVQDGIRRMYKNGEDIFYYITLYNDNYAQAAMPEGARDGILKGLYRLRKTTLATGPRAHLLGSGSILPHALKAQEMLAEYGVSADVWSATSYKELRRDCLEAERWSFLNPGKTPRKSYLETVLAKEDGVFLAVSDFMRSVPEMVSRWVPGGLFPLGTDGFGRSDTRPALRRHFEVDAPHIVAATLYQLCRKGQFPAAGVEAAYLKLGIDPDKLNPLTA